MAQLNDLIVLGNSNLVGETNINGNLNINSDVAIKNTLSVEGTTYLKNNIELTRTSNTNNPYLKLASSSGSAYLQLNGTSIGIGNGWTNSLQIDSSGNATLPGNMTAGKFIGNLEGNTTGHSRYLETLHYDKSAWYGANYRMYGWWETSSTCKLVVDGYQTKVDQATKDADGNTISSTYLKLTGGTITGNLTAQKFIGSLQGNADTATNVNIATDTTSKIYVLGATTTGNTKIYRESSVYMENNVLYGAAWNDYAEYRESNITQPGRCIIENGDDTLSLSTERLQRGAEIISDTFGFAIGETDTCKTPIATSGRVLAYGYENREQFKSHIGYPVCSGPNGTVSIMTDEEEQLYPSRIIGYVSAVPDYEIWGTGNVKVDGRIWIRIK